ncbi:hypothetical protein DN540_42170, partial [Burkholderia multivorans]
PRHLVSRQRCCLFLHCWPVENDSTLKIRRVHDVAIGDDDVIGQETAIVSTQSTDHLVSDSVEFVDGHPVFACHRHLIADQCHVLLTTAKAAPLVDRKLEKIEAIAVDGANCSAIVEVAEDGIVPQGLVKECTRLLGRA